MKNGDTEKYHLSSVIQDFVFSSRKSGCIRFISLQVYNNVLYCIGTLSRTTLYDTTSQQMTNKKYL